MTIHVYIRLYPNAKNNELDLPHWGAICCYFGFLKKAFVNLQSLVSFCWTSQTWLATRKDVLFWLSFDRQSRKVLCLVQFDRFLKSLISINLNKSRLCITIIMMHQATKCELIQNISVLSIVKHCLSEQNL